MTEMKRIRSIGMVAAAVACWSLVAPQLVYAAAPAKQSGDAPATTPKDVALGAGGTLRGQVVDTQGVAQANTRVALVKDSQLVQIVSTNQNGEFTATNLTGGVYQVGTEQGVGVFRLWAGRTAPPSANESALVVADGNVVRGQNGGWLSFLANPWVLAGIVAAAIAIPLAINNNGS